MSPDSPVTQESEYDNLSGAPVEPTVADANAEAQGTAKKELTRKEWKNLLRVYFTVRHPRVVQCGHLLNMGQQPRNNCVNCWFAFFNQHGELVNTADEVFRQYGPAGLTKMRGEKFTKNFTRFMATLAQWKAEQEGNAQSDAGSSLSGAAGFTTGPSAVVEGGVS